MPNLILTRCAGEKIVISEGQRRITLTFLDINHGKCRVGIEAPLEFMVHREEVQHRIDTGVPRREAKPR